MLLWLGMQMQYTCNRCTTRNVIDVNPHAYKEGTVFVQCGGCGVRHKLIDNLHISREFKPETSQYLGATASAAEERLRAIMPEHMLPLLEGTDDYGGFGK